MMTLLRHYRFGGEDAAGPTSHAVALVARAVLGEQETHQNTPPAHDQWTPLRGCLEPPTQGILNTFYLDELLVEYAFSTGFERGRKNSSNPRKQR